MEKICSKLLLIKAGSKIITTDADCTDICEFELLEDLEVQTTCESYYKVEKQGVLPRDGGTEV